MTIEQLQFFIMIERLSSFSEAANELFISQSTLSKQIKSLEEYLGFKLFERTTRTVRMTAVGEIFSQHAHNIITEYQAMLKETKRYLNDSQIINIAAIPVLAAYDLLDIFEDFQKDNPSIQIEVEEVDRTVALGALRRGNADMAILRSAFVSAEEFHTIPIREDEMVLVVPANHPIANRGEISLVETAKETFFFLSKHTGMHTFCIEECAKVGFFPTVKRSELSLSSITNKLKRDAGITMMAHAVALHLLSPDVSIVKLKERPIVDMAFVLKNERMEEKCSNLISYVKNRLASLTLS